MTTYAYHIVLNDTEAIAVREALTHYIAFCDRTGAGADIRSIQAVLSRLHSNVRMMSTSSACFPDNDEQ